MRSESPGVIEQQIQEWVRREVAYADFKMHGRCQKVVLKHLNIANQAQGDVCALPVKLEEGAEEEFEPLLHQIAQAAQRDANDQNSGVQKYAIYAYFPADKTYVPRKIFRVSPLEEDIDERNITPSEPPTEKGLVSQTMRHLEAVMRTATVSTGYQIQMMQKELERLSTHNQHYAEQQLDFMVLMQDTMNDATKRRLMERDAEANVAMKEDAMSKLNALLPVIINRLAGSQVLPEQDKSFMLMSALLENMSDEQQQAFYDQLTVAQRMTLAEIMSEYSKRKSKWLESQKTVSLGKENKLPPAALANTSLAVKSGISKKEVEVVEPVIPTAQSLSSRMTASTDKTRDPVLATLEADADAFVSRFKSFFKSPEEAK